MTTKTKTITGLVYVLKDNIDTDLIIPAKYLNLVPTIPAEYRKLGSYALAGLPDSFTKFVEENRDKSQYTIIVAGRNFGCGSSREHAPIALGAAGAKAVVAESYARIFFRNAVATGEIYPVESEDRLCDKFKTGDKATLNLETGIITSDKNKKNYKLKDLGAVRPVVEKGGLFGYARETGMISKKMPRSKAAGCKK